MAARPFYGLGVRAQGAMHVRTKGLRFRRMADAMTTELPDRPESQRLFPLCHWNERAALAEVCSVAIGALVPQLRVEVIQLLLKLLRSTGKQYHVADVQGPCNAECYPQPLQVLFHCSVLPSVQASDWTSRLKASVFLRSASSRRRWRTRHQYKSASENIVKNSTKDIRGSSDPSLDSRTGAGC